MFVLQCIICFVSYHTLSYESYNVLHIFAFCSPRSIFSALRSLHRASGCPEPSPCGNRPAVCWQPAGRFKATATTSTATLSLNAVCCRIFLCFSALDSGHATECYMFFCSLFFLNQGGRHSPSASHGKYRIGQRLGVRAECGECGKREKGRKGREREREIERAQCETNQIKSVCAFYTSMIFLNHKFVSQLFPCFIW